MNNNIQKAQDITEAASAGANLLIFGIAGIIDLINVIRYDKCEIHVQNNHCHKIAVVLDIPNENKLEGWYNIDAFTTSYIYKTIRRTYEVGIYAECTVCDSKWGPEREKYIPDHNGAFTIEGFEYDNSFYHYNQRCIKLSYANHLEKIKKYTFRIN